MTKKQTKSTLNFLPEDYLERKAQQRTNLVCLLLFVMVAVGVAATYLATMQNKRHLDKQANEVAGKLDSMRDILKQVEELELRRKQMETKSSICGQLIEPVPRSLLLAMITNHLPEGVSLLEYKLTNKVLADKNAPADKNLNKKAAAVAAGKKGKKADEAAELTVPKMQTTIKIVGLAQNDSQVAAFIANLNKSKLLSQVNLGQSKECTINTELLRQFELEVNLTPGSRATPEDVQVARQWNLERKQKATHDSGGTMLGNITKKLLQNKK